MYDYGNIQHPRTSALSSLIVNWPLVIKCVKLHGTGALDLHYAIATLGSCLIDNNSSLSSNPLIANTRASYVRARLTMLVDGVESEAFSDEWLRIRGARECGNNDDVMWLWLWLWLL